jgi:two-component system, LytTR family, response regulator
VSQRIRALLVDDEAAALRGLRLLLKEDSDVEIVGECRSGQEALAAIRGATPDLVFLDVQMPGLNGFDVLARLDQQRMPLIVFVTAYDRYALKAFEAHALDYILKPFTDRRFHQVLARAKSQIRRADLAAAAERIEELLKERRAVVNANVDRTASKYLEHLAIKTDERVVLIDVSTIDWIEANNDYVVVHTAGQQHPVRERMKDMETRLDPKRFVRIHRSSIVNVARIRELQPYFHGDYVVIMNDGTRLRLSRGRRDCLSSIIGRPL